MAISYEKQIYKMYEKEVAKNERLSKRCEKLQIELNSIKAENKMLQKKMDNIDEYINNRINKTVAQLTEKFDTEVKELKNQIKIKDEEIERLRNHINKNSTNSNKPSSTNMFPIKQENTSANQYNYRRKTCRKSGGQFGHKGYYLDKLKLEKIIKNTNTQIEEFTHEIKGSEKKEDIVKYKIGLKIITVLERHIFKFKNDNKEKMSKEFYQDISYGNSIKALVVALGGYETISYNRITDLISEISDGNINLSEGTIRNFYQEFYNKSEATMKNIENNILNEEVMNTDETNGKCNGKLCFFRCYSNERNVLYRSHKNKGDKPIKEDNILPRYIGCIVADHDTGIYKYGRKHQECIVHTGRYLEEITQNVKETNWQNEMSRFFFRTNETRKMAKQYGETSFSEEKEKELLKEYDEILERAKLENKKIESEYYKAKAEKLRRRLIKYKESQLLYIKEFKVPFDNNISERDLRMIKNKMKISGGFKSMNGASTFASVISIAKTSIKRKVNPLKSINDIFSNKILFGYDS